MNLYNLRTLPFWLVIALLLGAADGPFFNGCGSIAPDLPPEGRPLPQADASGCSMADDCATDECTRFDCLAGTCVELPGQRDDDGDGDAPIPCGTDCNDQDPFVLGSAFELCDGIDNDCDGSADEGLSMWGLETAALAGISPTGMAAMSDIFVVAQAGRSAIFARRVLPGPQVLSPVEAMRLGGGSEFLRVELAQSGDDHLTLLAITDLGTILHTEIDRRPVDGRLSQARPRETLGNTVLDPENRGSFWFASHGGGVALAYLTSPSDGVVQAIVQPALDAAPWVIATGDGSGGPTLRGFASDGANLAVGIASEGVLFLGPDGTELSRTPFPSSVEGNPFSDDPLSSGDGHVTLALNLSGETVQLSELSAVAPARQIFTGSLLHGSEGNSLYTNAQGAWVTSVQIGEEIGLQLLTSGSSEFRTTPVPTPYANETATTRFASYGARTALLTSNAAGTSVLYTVSKCGP